MQWCLLHALGAACCLVASTLAGAGESSGPPLTLRDAIDHARLNQPALAGLVFEMRVQEARATGAGLRPAPQAELLLEDAFGTGDRGGLEAAQATLSLSQLIELGGKRDGRIAVSAAASSRLRTVQAARQLDVFAEVARRFLGTLSWQAQSSIARDGVAIARRTQEAVRQRVSAARAPAAEALRAEVNLLEAELVVEDAEHELETARHSLAAAMGEAAASFGDAAGELLSLSSSLPFEALLARLQQSPDFLLFADESRLREAELRLAQMRRRPDLRATVGARQYRQGDDVALVAGVTMPLYSARHAQAEIDVARARRDQVAGERETAFLKAGAQLFGQHQALEHARHEFRLLRDEIVPRLEAALAQTEYAYQQGRYTFLDLSSAQQALLAARRRQIDVATEFHTLRVEIERLTGESLETSGETP